MAVDNLILGEDYKFDLSVRKRLLLLDLTVLKQSYDNLWVKLRKKKDIAYIDPDTLEAILILINEEAPMNVKNVQLPPDETLVEGVEVVGNLVGGVATSVGIIGLLIALCVSCFQTNVGGGGIIRFILIFKVIDRLKFLNIDFGIFLTPFLDQISGILRFGSKSNRKNQTYAESQDMFYYTKTRGKLSLYQVDQLALYRMPEKYLIYLVKILNNFSLGYMVYGYPEIDVLAVR